MPLPTFPFHIALGADDAEEFRKPGIDEHEGGFATLMRAMRDQWHTHPEYLVISDWTTWKRIKDYADYRGGGGWENVIKRWAKQLPDDVPNPQSGLFE